MISSRKLFLARVGIGVYNLMEILFLSSMIMITGVAMKDYLLSVGEGHNVSALTIHNSLLYGKLLETNVEAFPASLSPPNTPPPPHLLEMH